jgi:predicted transcriptional regulator
MPAAVPRRPHVALSLRLPPDLHRRLTEIAEREHRSLTAEVIHLLEEAAARIERQREYPQVAEDHGPPYRPHGGE